MPCPLTAPPPATVTDSVLRSPPPFGMKRPVTLFEVSIETMQVVDVPAHAPLQPAKAEPAEGTACSATSAPCPNVSEQVVWHEIAVPAGIASPVIVPEPVPSVSMDSWWTSGLIGMPGPGLRSNFAHSSPPTQTLQTDCGP